MKKIFLLALLLSIFCLSKGQNTLNWKWGYNFPGISIKSEYYNNNVYVAGYYTQSFQIGGYTIPYSGGKDAFIAKFDTSGNVIWIKNIIGTRNETINSLKIKNNQLYVLGNFNSSSISTGVSTLISNGGTDEFLVKYDINGIELDAKSFGTITNNIAYDICIDNNSNYYIGRDSSITKYNNAGVQIWQITTPKIVNLHYSEIDSTIVFAGYFQATFTLNGITLNPNIMGSVGPMDDIFCGKLNVNGTALWLTNCSNNGRQDCNLHSTINQNTGKIYFSYLYVGLAQDYFYISELDKNGLNLVVLKYFSQDPFYSPVNRSHALSIQNGILLLDFVNDLSYTSYLIFINLNNNNSTNYLNFDLEPNGVFSGNFNDLAICFKNVNEIYTIGTTQTGLYDSLHYKTFGRLNGNLLYSNVNKQTINACAGNVVQLQSNIYGGFPPYSKIWAPNSGLSNINSDTVSFIATSNITYTLSITDSLGYTKIDTFIILVNSPSTSSTSASVCSNALPYVWNGQNITASGTYTANFTNAVGCDSVASLVLTVNSPSTSSTSASVCSNALPYVWNGQNITASGTYTANFTNAVGCDSVASLVLTVNSPSTSSTSASVCSNTLPYVWNGQNITASGTYTANFTNAVGCDSVASLVLTVNSPSTSSTSASVCSNTLPYVWNGQNITASGTYTANFTNAVGCDSVASLVLTVKSPSTSSTSASVCSNALPYVWNGQNITASGTYTANFFNAVGCDSVASLVLTVKSPSTSSTSASVCSNALPYVWNGQNITASGTYTANFTNAVGCDSVASLVLIVNSPSTSSTSASVCSNALPYVWNGQNITASGTYTANFTNAVGCDSVASLVLTVKSPSTSSTSASVCSNALPYVWNGQNITASGTYTANFTNAVGCDSVASLVLIVNSPSTSSTSASVCSNALPYVWNGQNITASGTYTANFTNAVGCDSVASLVLTVKSPSTSSTSASVCSNALPYVWNGQNITGSGTYTVNLINASGCDSIITLLLTVNQIGSPIITQFNNMLICTNVVGVNYQWFLDSVALGTNNDSILINSNGHYSVITTDTVGCYGIDTINIINLSTNDLTYKLNSPVVYPNPTNSIINIEYNIINGSKFELQILDITGNVIMRKVNNEVLNSGKHVMELNIKQLNLAYGSYVLKLNYNNTVFYKKIIYNQ